MTDFAKDLNSTNNVVKRRAEEMRTRLLNNVDEFSVNEEGVMRWNSNDQVPPSDIVDFASQLMDDISNIASDEARKVDQAAFFETYREGRRNMNADQKREEAFERRAAFGPGETVIDIVTGERFRT